MSTIRVSDEILDHLQNLCQLRKFKPGEVVTVKGESHESMYFILSGWVDIRFFEDGEETTPLRLGEKSALGEMSFLSGECAVATAVAVTFVNALELDHETLERFRAENPRAAEEFSTYLAATVDKRLRSR